MTTEYNLRWLRELIREHLNFKRNSIGQRVQAHAYLYSVEYLSNLNELLISVEKSNRILPIVRISPTLNQQWYYPVRPHSPWPPGVSEMPTTRQDDEEYEFYVFTKYQLDNLFSFFT